MPRRITVPDEHVAVILPNQLGDELMSLLKLYRSELGRVIERARRAQREPDSLAIGQYGIAGEVMLALLEAKEA